MLYICHCFEGSILAVCNRTAKICAVLIQLRHIHRRGLHQDTVSVLGSVVLLLLQNIAIEIIGKARILECFLGVFCHTCPYRFPKSANSVHILGLSFGGKLPVVARCILLVLNNSSILPLQFVDVHSNAHQGGIVAGRAVIFRVTGTGIVVRKFAGCDIENLKSLQILLGFIFRFL